MEWIGLAPVCKEAEGPHQLTMLFLCSHLSKTKDLEGITPIECRVDATRIDFIWSEAVPWQEEFSHNIHHISDTEAKVGFSLHVG